MTPCTVAAEVVFGVVLAELILTGWLLVDAVRRRRR